MEDDRSKKLLQNKSFWVRTLSGFIMSVILIAVFVLGYDVMLIFVAFLSIMGAFELYRALKIQWQPIAFIGYIAIIGHYIFLRFLNNKYIILIYAAAMIFILVFFVLTFPKYTIQQVFGSFFGIFYTGIMLSFLYLLRIHEPSGAYLVWLIVFSSWGCDIFAYLFGMLFGKHPFVPKLSPKKSVEGAIGGILGAVVLAFVYGLIVQQYIPDIKYAPYIFAIVCLFGSMISQVGDLAASAIKRQVGIKDYGKILPGHGGILDRFDSMIIVAPVIYLITIYAVVV